MELYIDGGDRAKNEPAFDALRDEGAAIEQQIGLPVIWQRLNDKQACRIYCDTAGSIDDDTAHLEDLTEWAAEPVGKFHQVFKPRVQRLKL